MAPPGLPVSLRRDRPEPSTWGASAENMMGAMPECRGRTVASPISKDWAALSVLTSVATVSSVH